MFHALARPLNTLREGDETRRRKAIQVEGRAKQENVSVSILATIDESLAKGPTLPLEALTSPIGGGVDTASGS